MTEGNRTCERHLDITFDRKQKDSSISVWFMQLLSKQSVLAFDYLKCLSFFFFFFFFFFFLFGIRLLLIQKI